MTGSKYAKIKKVWWYIFLPVTIITAGTLLNPSLAYSPFYTHPDLTEEMAKLYNTKHPNSILDAAAIAALRQGAIEEDDPPRWINHFYDPKNKEGWRGKHFGRLSEADGFNTAAPLAPVAPLPSINWVKNQAAQAAYGRQFGNQTWQKAIDLYTKGQTREAFVALGHVLHLVEDASVPDHTRNDTHAHIYGDPGSPYEDASSEFTNNHRLTVAKELAAAGLSIPYYSTIESSIEEIAVYSNENFFSEDTISNEEYKLPNLKELKEQEIDSKDGIIIYLMKDSRYLAYKKTVGHSSSYSIDEVTYIQPSYRAHLFPKVILNGTGVIELFFREVAAAQANPELLPPIIDDSKQSLISMLPHAIEFLALWANDGFGRDQADWDKFSLQVNELIEEVRGNSGPTTTSLYVMPLLSVSSNPNTVPVAPSPSTPILPASTSTAAPATTFKPPSGNLVLYPSTPKPSYTTIQPLAAATVRTPDPVVLGNGSLARVSVSDSARSKEIVNSFNTYLDKLKKLEQSRPADAIQKNTAEDIRSVVSEADLRSAMGLVGSVNNQEQLSAQLSNNNVSPSAIAGLLLILSLGLSSWALAYEEARLQTERANALNKEATDFRIATLQTQEQRAKEALAKIIPPTPKLFRTSDWVDATGRHFAVYGFVVNGVWHPILDTSEVERIFGKDNSLPMVSYGSYSFGWDPVHGGGTVGSAMSLRQLWQMQSAVIDGTLPATIEQYARGERGTMHPLGWEFSPSQMYNPNDGTIYIVDQSSMGRFYDILGWTSISVDTPKTNISNFAFDTPEAFLNKTPWNKEFTLRNLEYTPNHIYSTPIPTDFENYFKAERQKGRAVEDIYQHNPFQILTVPTTVAQTNQKSGGTIATSYSLTPTTYQSAPTWLIPFRSGLTQKQQDSITNLLTNRYQTHTTLNETDAKNYAFAIGESNFSKFIGKYAEQISVRV